MPHDATTTMVDMLSATHVDFLLHTWLTGAAATDAVQS